MSGILEKIKENIEIVIGVIAICLLVVAIVFYNKGKTSSSCPSGQSCRAPPPRCPAVTGSTGSGSTGSGTGLGTGSGSTGTGNSNSITSINYDIPTYVIFRPTRGETSNRNLIHPSYFAFNLNPVTKTMSWQDQGNSFMFIGSSLSGELESEENPLLKLLMTGKNDKIVDIRYNSCGTVTSDKVRMTIKSDGKIYLSPKNTASVDPRGGLLSVGQCGNERDHQYNGILSGSIANLF